MSSALGFVGGVIFTTAPRGRDYEDTRHVAVIGTLAGGERKQVRLVIAARPDKQAQLYWCRLHLAANVRRWKRFVRQRRVRLFRVVV